MGPRTPPHLAKQPSFFADTTPPPPAESPAPATPPSSGRRKGPHRDGFSVKKCRSVLVRQCSWIPRNYNFKDGVNQVYEVLREYLGDENLDLAIAQLHELIEVPSQWLHDEGASFQPWKHDYMLRHKDLENSHVPRLRNIIVAPVNPTERLKRWREDHPEREPASMSSSQSSQTPSSGSEIQPTTPDYRIGTGARGGDWRLENAIFVSSRTQGTRVLHCPSAQELHKKTWNEDFGRGGKFVQERIVNPGELVDGIEEVTDHFLSLQRKKPVVNLPLQRSLDEVSVLQRIRSSKLVPEKLNTCLHGKLSARGRGWYSKQKDTRKTGQARTTVYQPDPLLGRFITEVKTYEGDPAVRDLPDPESDIGKPYYSNILNWPLPPGIRVPSPRFARKHRLVPDETPLPGWAVIKLVPTADEIAIEKNLQVIPGPNGSTAGFDLAGPFTPELFKDSGIDFPQHWGNVEHVPYRSRVHIDALPDLSKLGDSAQSPTKHMQSTNENVNRLLQMPSLTDSGKENSFYAEDVLSRRSLKFSRAGSLHSLNGHLWRSSVWKTCNIALRRASLCEPEVTSAKPLINLISIVAKKSSGVSHPEQVADAQRLLSKKKRSLELLGSLKPQRSGSAPTLAVKDVIMKPANPPRSSATIAGVSFTSSRNANEAGKENESATLKVISRIAVNPPPRDQNAQTTQRYNAEKVPAKKERQRHNIVLMTTGDSPVIVSTFHDSNSTVTEKEIDAKSTVELALEILKRTGHECSESLLNCGCGARNNARVLKNVNVNKEAVGKYNNNNNNHLFKLPTRSSLHSESYISLALIHTSEGNSKGSSNIQENLEMDLNRDLPPLPLTVDSQPAQRSDQSKHRSLESVLDSSSELLQPLCYDPVRDSLKYGGLHYHPDGMRYHSEVTQHPPRTSSIPKANSPLVVAEGSTQHHVQARRLPHPSPIAEALVPALLQLTRVSDASNSSRGSAGIMGNFIPVKETASSSVIASSALQLPRIKTDQSTWTTGQNHKLVSTYEKAAIQELADSHESTKIESSGVKDSYNMNIQQGLGGSSTLKNHHGSIDLNDPEALGKYLRQLKKLKNQHIGTGNGSPGPNSSLSQNFDGETGRYVEHNNADDYADADSDEDIEGYHLAALDYSEIRAGNPFEPDPGDIRNDPDRITTLRDFMGGINDTYESSTRQLPAKKSFLKNSHSESNAFYTKKQPVPTQVVDRNNASRHLLQRSDSSPNMSRTRIAARRSVAQESFQSFYGENSHSSSDTVSHKKETNDASRSRIRGDDLSRNLPKLLDNVLENREPSPSPKRPWSPVKKLFGEGGWLGSVTSPKDESGTPKKPGLVEKIKLKIEEIGLKADLSPMKHPSRPVQDNYGEQSTFPVSLNPAQQAELYLDIELLICDSANTFLMNEYHNGRMSVDSLKKVTDFWKSKGRPQVVEFHYDQSTQRDLIVTNQKSFRFYGPNANNPVKVNAMLYAWKSNAREMAVRTFCYPDSMIRKHVRDAFVILDFLGGHPFQYIAAHEVQRKLVAWINDVHILGTTRSSGNFNAQQVGHSSNESPTDLVIGNPWHSANKPIQRPNKQSSDPGEARPKT